MSHKYILGFSAFYHDSAAAIIKDNEIIAATHEERFTRVKHDKNFPINSINYCLQAAKCNADEIDAFVYYDSPILTLDRVLSNSISAGKKSNNLLINSLESFFKEQGDIPTKLIKYFGSLGKEEKLLFVEHHMAHASAAYYPSPFNNAAILTIDGVGEWATTTIGVGENNIVKLYKEIRYPHSIGLLYSAFTSYCGFKVNTGEYKLMGLAPYGKPKYSKLIIDKLIDIKEDGSFQLNMDYFSYMYDKKMFNKYFCDIFGMPPRNPESNIENFYLDIASSIQKVTENVILKLVKHTREIYDVDNLVMAGGVALNCVANGKIIKNKIFKNLWVQPAAGDAGSAIGAAMLAYYNYFETNKKKIINKIDDKDKMYGSRLGPSFKLDEIKAYLDKHDISNKLYKDKKTLSNKIAKLISKGQIVGLFQGRVEFGPRALGSRSILGDARDHKTQSKMNLKIKYRESFRPFAPAIMYDKVSDYFDLNIESPYMLLVTKVNEDIIYKTENNSDDIYEIVNQKRSSIPAVTHVDYSARVQTVHPDNDSFFYSILNSFYELTGCPVIVNTSFNVRGEPIVCTPEDAFNCFMSTEMDILVLENYLIEKKNLSDHLTNADWGREYELD